ncbi:MAG: hypothetical protein H6644_14850 [Caldilineaceae bacterium]|nr:hypothetical protein [Caldilineaceae bacterium]
MTAQHNQFVISITSRDRVGIVYEVATALSELRGDIADVRQSVLCGYFTMILLVTFPPEVTPRAVERKLSELDANSETAIAATVTAVHNAAVAAPGVVPAHSYVLTAIGRDRIGFVAAVAGFCADHAINILDLSTTVKDGSYVMILLVDLSGCASIQQVRADLARFAAATEFSLVLQHHDIFRATNEIA